MKKREFLAMSGALPLMLVGCGGDGSGSATARLVNASVGYASLDLLVNDTTVASDVAYGTASAYGSVSAGSVTNVLAVAGANLGLPTTRTLGKDTRYSVVAYGAAGSAKTLLITESTTAPDSGYANVNVLNTSADVGAVDVYITPTEDISSSVAQNKNVVAVSQSVFAAIPAQAGGTTYVITVTGFDDKSDIRQVITGVTLVDQQITTIILTSGSGGVLTNAVQMTANNATVTRYDNTKARVRIVTSLGDRSPVSATKDGISVGDATSSPAIGSYVAVDAAGALPIVTVAGNPLPGFTGYTGTAGNSPTALLPGGDYTILVYGDTAANAVAKLYADLNARPLVASNVRIRLINAFSQNQGNLTLQVHNTNVASNVPYGTISPYFETDARTTESNVQLTQDLVPIPTSLTTTTLAANSVYTMFVLDNPANTATPPVPVVVFSAERDNT